MYKNCNENVNLRKTNFLTYKIGQIVFFIATLYIKDKPLQCIV